MADDFAAKLAGGLAGMFRRRVRALVVLSNWPFSLKMAFCPTLAMILLVGMGLHGILAANEQAALIRAVVQHDLSVATRLSEAAARLREIDVRLYRMTALQAGKTPDLEVETAIAGLVSETGALAADLDSEASAEDMAAERSDLRQVASEIRIYRDTIEVFGSMLEIDFNSAVEFFRPFDKNAKKVIDTIGEISDRATFDASNRARSSISLAEHIRLTLIATSIAGSLLLFGAGALLTRATVRSVKRIAAATENVARGGSKVDVGALERGDELGTIVRSLAVFQANVAQIAFLAHHDALTKLPNRALFHDRIQQALAQLDRGEQFAVFCLDLDRFKTVNDTLGHPVGDGLLRQVAERLQACVREGDTVARLGGDEFAIILLDTNDPSEVDALATRILHSIAVDFEVDGHLISIGTSIGMVLVPADGAVADDILKKADTALYGAKTAGRGTSCFYEDSMNAELQLRREIEVGLRRALIENEFQLYYQPLVHARSRHVTSFEALIRWNDPEKGIVLPDAFIKIAETAGLIGPIGQWVLRAACFEAASWPQDLKIAINLSPVQFKDKSLVSSVRAALADSGLAANRLELEITESVLLHDSAEIMAVLREMKALGVQISMDDFGTGYSSLSYLRSFPFDKVKIDRSFIRDLPGDRNALAIVRAIVGLGETFGISITAEGVETDEQATELERENCTSLQGFLFSRPVPVEQILGLVTRLSASSMVTEPAPASAEP